MDRWDGAEASTGMTGRAMAHLTQAWRGRGERPRRGRDGRLPGAAPILVATALVVGLIAGGCTVEGLMGAGGTEQAGSSHFAARVDPSAVGVAIVPSTGATLPVGPRGPAAPQDDEGLAELSASVFHRADRGIIYNEDGTLTKFYYFRAGRGAEFEKILLAHVPEFAALPEPNRKNHPNFIQDPRLPNTQTYYAGQGISTGVGNVADVLVVRASEEAHTEISHFLERLIVDPPQVEIEAQIVEIQLDDHLEWGLTATGTRGTEEDPAATFFKTGTLTLPADSEEGVALDFMGIHDQTTMQLFIQFIVTNTKSDILAMPKMLVLNGHRGVIDTGEETPVLQPKFGSTGDVTGGTVAFKPTGIKLIIVPWILMDDVVELDVHVEVSAVTSFVTVGTIAGSPIETPQVSARRAITVVKVRSGQTLAIGGLLATTDIDTVVKVPVLGDIPLLGYLFKSRVRTKKRSEVIFFITPRLKSLQEEVLFDPSRR